MTANDQKTLENWLGRKANYYETQMYEALLGSQKEVNKCDGWRYWLTVWAFVGPLLAYFLTAVGRI